MPIVRQFAAMVIDVNDLDLEAVFWGRVIGEEPGPVRGEGGWVTVGSLATGVQLVLQKVPEPKTVKDRIHLDFMVDDVAVAVEQVMRLGGRQLGDPRPGGGVTMADPEGNEFCLGSFLRTKAGKRVPL
ncbi:MAG: VOC family protein [Chloroflexi bacterium]|nr:VOC family protein [Chloroflexota bacterium]MDA1298343.1 VOC family protein [Chloroflexota bacterium]